MRKWCCLASILFVFIFCFGILGIFVGEAAAKEESLQSRIDSTPKGGTLHLEAGIYTEPITLSKPIMLEGERGTVFQVCSPKPVLTIKGERVEVKDLQIINCKTGGNTTTIYITGKEHYLQNITLDAEEIGLQLEKTENSVFQNINITGYGKANGVQIWGSAGNTFTGNTIEHVQDGFYMENSPHNTFIDNVIRNSRYGLHVMYSDYITALMNTSEQNITGSMIMGTNHSVIQGNQLIKNKKNVNAQGMLLFEVKNSSIRENRMEENRVGLFIEDSTGNEIVDNELSANFIGTQINRIEKNIITGNAFTRNVIDFQATAAANNIIQENFWDTALKLDTDGNHKSNLPHTADPFFLSLVRETPPYQLFFQHPGMLLLQKMLKSPEDLVVTDSEPLMERKYQNLNTTNHEASILLWSISLLLIVSSSGMIYIGRRNK